MKFTTTEKIIMTQQNLVIFDHPLISHKIALLRSVETGAKQFRELVEEITVSYTHLTLPTNSLV